MRTPWPVFALEFLTVVACLVLTGFAFGWGIAAGFLVMFVVLGVVALLAGRRFAGRA
jgi:hypothetical protein